tara:strand:+ start:36 stop:341 length:306 start_codon:yes stop_codon:yes gene_type:complete
MNKEESSKKKDVFDKKPKATKVKVEKKKGAEDEEQLYDNLKIKEGGLRASLKVGKDYKFSKSKLTPLLKAEIGKTFTFDNKKIKMTEKMKKQIQLAINMMK